MQDLKQFEKQQYLSIETFRKNGTGVKTPVWFVQEGEIFYIWTEFSSGKAKRIRNNGKVNIVPSKADGTPIGEWLPVKAGTDDSDASIQHVKTLMRKKYGLMFSMFALVAKFRGTKPVSIRVDAA